MWSGRGTAPAVPVSGKWAMYAIVYLIGAILLLIVRLRLLGLL